MNTLTVSMRVLIIESNQADFLQVSQYLAEEFSMLSICREEQFEAAKKDDKFSSGYDVILVGNACPEDEATTVMQEAVNLAGSTPVILLVSSANPDLGINTITLGIADYILKDELTASVLYKSICFSIERKKISFDLTTSEHNYQQLFKLSPIPMYVYNWETAKIVNINNAALSHYGYSRPEFLSMDLYTLAPPEDANKVREKIRTVLVVQGFKRSILRHIKRNGDVIDVEAYSQLYSAEQKTRLVLVNDITVSTYQKSIFALEKKVYELNASPAIPFSEILVILTSSIEKIMAQSYCTILQKNDDDTIRSLSDGSMPHEYIQLIDGLLIGPQSGSCGTAMFTGQNTFVADIDSDVLWRDYAAYIRPFGFKACWSVPIKKSDGQVLGTFATYYKTVKYPLRHQVNLLERVARLLGIIIENRKAVEDIKEWNERYDMVTKATSEVIWDWELATDKILWSQGLQTIFGYHEPENITSIKWWANRVHPKERNIVIKKLYRHVDNKIIRWEDKYRFQCEDGTFKYIFDRGFLVLDKNNVAIRMVSAMQDITRQVEEEHRLKLLESVITNTTDSVIITEVDMMDFLHHKIMYVNKAFTKMTGYTKEEIMGKTPKLFQGLNTGQHELERLKKAMSEWKPCEIEVINYKKSGEPFWNNICVSPVADSAGIYTHWIAIERDVTLRRSKEDQITKAIINTQERERFQIGGELHDNVNQILAGVLLNLAMTKDTSNQSHNQYVSASIEYTNMAIGEIRSLTHRLAPVGFEESSLKRTFKRLLESINVNNKFKIACRIEEISHKAIGSDIQLNLYRILQEQVTNIVKYSKADTIDVSLRLLNDNVQLCIEDNGIGFNIKKCKGGIGINNMKKRTEMFSGNFSLISSQGNGCRIVVEIPIANSL